jgi:hypothetical protein
MFNITADLENNQWVGLGFSDKKTNVKNIIYLYTTKLIMLNITADLENNQWVGLGFSDKKQMVRTLFIYLPLTFRTTFSWSFSVLCT